MCKSPNSPDPLPGGDVCWNLNQIWCNTWYVVLNTAICCKYDEKYEKKSYKSSDIQWSNGGRRVIKSGEDSQKPIVAKVVKKIFFSGIFIKFMRCRFQLCAQLGSCNGYFFQDRPLNLKSHFWKGSFHRPTSRSKWVGETDYVHPLALPPLQWEERQGAASGRWQHVGGIFSCLA